MLSRENEEAQRHFEVRQLEADVALPANANVNRAHRAVIELNPDALDIARERDGERRRGFVRGPLHGIPFLVKDVSGILTNSAPCRETRSALF